MQACGHPWVGIQGRKNCELIREKKKTKKNSIECGHEQAISRRIPTVRMIRKVFNHMGRQGVQIQRIGHSFSPHIRSAKMKMLTISSVGEVWSQDGVQSADGSMSWPIQCEDLPVSGNTEGAYTYPHTAPLDSEKISHRLNIWGSWLQPWLFFYFYFLVLGIRLRGNWPLSHIPSPILYFI